MEKTMDRRTFNKMASFAAVSALTESAALAGAEQNAATAENAPGSPVEIVLQDQEFLAAFDALSGALIRLERKSTQWMIERRPELGVSFRLHAPLPDRRDNFVLGRKQRAAKVEKVSDHQVELQWKNLISEHGGVLPITLDATVTIENGVLTFQSTLINDSPVTVETIDYPYFGDLRPPHPDAVMQTYQLNYGGFRSGEIYPHFNNEKGDCSVNFPTKSIESKQSLLCLIQSPQEGLYVLMPDPSVPYLLEYTFEQHPGLVTSNGSEVPREDEISGLPVHLEFRTCHFVFAHPHSTVKLVPVVMRGYSGDWHAGLDLYKAWRKTWFKPTPVPAWAQQVHSWLQLRINSPEEEYTVSYRDVVKYAEECAKNGVTAIQLVGWNHGGQDRGDPSQDIDPGLGTWQELHDAIAQSQAMGVKIILFGKLNWADKSTEWQKKELYQYAATDPYGIPYEQIGYSYTTPTQLASINTRRRDIMDVLSPSYRDIATREFQKLLDLGAAGWLFDEVCHHGVADYSFSPNHGYAPPGYIYAGDIPMAKQMRAAADKVNPDFLFAGEAPMDWLLPYYRLSYFRIFGGAKPATRYIDPRAPLMVAVNGFDDREMLNLMLAYRYIISYEPYYFKGHITDFPLTLAYGKKIDGLRRRYKEWVWDAEFRDTVGASVNADGTHRHTVFVTASGKRAVVVVNEEPKKAITATVELPNPGKLVVATPEEPEAQPTSGALEVPARSAAIVMET
jgi:hypothetical protein